MTTIKYTSVSFLIFVFLLPLTLLAQEKNDKTVVGTVGKEKITYAEVRDNYTAGSRSDFTLKELEEFLPLYLEYKAKLISAKDIGYYDDSVLVAEHEQYAKQAAYAYWLEKEIRPTAFDTYYKRATSEIKAFHILIATKQNASPQEIEEAKEKLYEAKKEIEAGHPLDEVDKKYSTVRNGRSMGGDLPWLSAGRTVKEFEDQIYSLEPGEISEPFATQFGHHIVLLQDKRERTPARLTNHIFIRPTQDSAAYLKAQEAYNYLEEGKSWNDVMQQYTEDEASKGKNGQIGWVSFHSNFAGPFIDAVNKVDPELEFSEPIRTSYGYHIFQIDSVQTYSSEDELKKEIEKELEQSNYYKENNAFIVDYLKKKFGEKKHTDARNEYKQLITGMDTTLISDITLPSSISSKSVYTFNDKIFTVADFHDYLKEAHHNKQAKKYRNKWFDSFTQYAVDSQLIDLTIANHPEFAYQSENYLNGLMVYKINDDFLWSAATVDSTRLNELYENQTEKYSYQSRPFYYLLTASHDSTLHKAIDFVNDGNSPDSIRTYNKKIAVTSDSTSSYDEDPYDRLSTMEKNTFSDIFEYNKRKAVFYLKDILPARNMTFDEAFNRLLADHQPEREENWLKQLRQDYKVKANKKNLKKAFKKDPLASK